MNTVHFLIEETNEESKEVLKLVQYTIRDCIEEFDEQTHITPITIEKTNELTLLESAPARVFHFDNNKILLLS